MGSGSKRLCSVEYYRKKAVRGKNPVPLSERTKIRNATRALEDFTGQDALHLDIIKDTGNNVFFEVGSLDGILYTTVRDGNTEKYIHEFNKKSRPQLITSHDGKTLRSIGGNFLFTDRGFEDQS